jgi:hypothetical protein
VDCGQFGRIRNYGLHRDREPWWGDVFDGVDLLHYFFSE